jgi:LruC domain-containing protein
MKQLQWAAIAAISIMIGMTISCGRNVFDEQKYKDIVDSISPVDSVDATHTWTLTKLKTTTVQIPDSDDMQRVMILTSNPRETGDAAVVGEAWGSAGEKVLMTFSYPSTMTKLYAALMDDDGYYCIEEYYPDTQSTIDFSDLIVDHEKLSYEPQPLLYTYCFEEEYPAPGDYDYNDVVLRISQQRTGEREMRFMVQLAAVGAQDQIAAAISLGGFKASDIESVTTVDSLSFNRTNGKDLPDQIKSVVPVTKTEFYESFMSTGRHDEAVLNLFGDAHWATGDLLEENFGMMDRKKYNVYNTVSSDHPQFVPRSITYVVTFKSSAGLNGFSMDQLDPFIIKSYNGGNFEVHQYVYRDAQVLYNYSLSVIENLPWALCIPMGDFRWPLEGKNMGFIMREVHTYGAYQTSGHSFGEWAMDHNKATDWYYYPNKNNVF